MFSPSLKSLGIVALLASAIACSDDDSTGPRYRYSFSADQEALALKQYEQAEFSTTLVNETLGGEQEHGIVAWAVDSKIAVEQVEQEDGSTAWTVQANEVGTSGVVVAWAGLRDTIEVTVAENPVTSVTIQEGDFSVEEGEDAELTVILANADGDVLVGPTVTWTSSNTDVATVDADGVVTGVDAGTAVITAEVDGATDTVTVTVTAPPVIVVP